MSHVRAASSRAASENSHHHCTPVPTHSLHHTARGGRRNPPGEDSDKMLTTRSAVLGPAPGTGKAGCWAAAGSSGPLKGNPLTMLGAYGKSLDFCSWGRGWHTCSGECCRVQTCPCHSWSGQGPILHTCISTIPFCLCSREAREGTGALAPSSTRVGRNLLSGWWHPYYILSGCFTRCCDTHSSPRRTAMVRDAWGGKKWETEPSTEQHRGIKSPWKGEESPRTLGSSV